MIALAFDRCEAPSSGDICGRHPDAICSGCGTARCTDHAVGADDDRCCSACAASLLMLETASFDDVLDTRMRLLSVSGF